MKKVLLLSTVFIFAISSLTADFNRMGIPDSAEIRRSCAESWFYDDVKDLREKRSELRKNALGQEFQIRLEEAGSSFAVVIAPQMKLDVDFYTENGIERRTVDDYPGDAAGAWLLVRNALTGRPEQIKVYFTADSSVYIQLTPQNNKTLADFVIEGLYAARGVPVGVPFENLYTASFQDIISLTEKSLPWQYANTQKGQYQSKLQMIGVIRKNLGRIAYMDDTCYDENGQLVYISDGSRRKIESNIDFSKMVLVDQCGFLKWVVDGLVEPLTGSKLYLKPLRVKTVEYDPLGLNGVLDQKENLSFTLDWCRNLAAAHVSIRTKRNYMWNESGTDVSIEPFGSEVSSEGLSQAAGYIKNTGYKISALRPVLYVLAATEPAFGYLAAIKRPLRNNSKDPEFFKFDECAVIFPFFDENGRFSCVIFENGRELTLNAFISKYSGCFVHLSRFLTETRFFPD